ncbi:hypothetical protein [Leifsonia sp. Root227]|uniref:hypothetical protein n=1 Tax=Leifsonia sp. Root227 TaxID=1736496 RepID=UPI0012FBD549|nr:hypothetical protein [Leifsonia sp. Root227]
MSDTRWRVRPTNWDDDQHAYYHHQFVAVKNSAKLFGDTIGEVHDLIAFHEGERP